MAQASNKSSDNKASKKQQTVRERTLAGDSGKRKRIRRNAGRVASPLRKLNVFKLLKKIARPLPDNGFGRILRRIGRIIFPRFISDAGREITLVKWPNFRETTRLTLAVFIFSVIFAAIVGVLDFGLDKLFREVVVGK